MEIAILLENSSIDSRYKSKHGLSIFIKFHDLNILLDTGPDRNFFLNAKKMNLDLAKVEMLFLSHAHYDHTGGLNEFLKLNNNAAVYIMDSINSKYYSNRKFFNISIGLKLKRKNSGRITQLEKDFNPGNNIYFLKNTILCNQKPASNRTLMKEVDRKLKADAFDHEGILVFDDNGELAIFNSCSHNGLLNIIKTAEEKIPNKKIKAYVGGLHLSNPKTQEHESDEYLDVLIGELKKKEITVYTGHCTGKYAFDYLKSALKENIQKISTGMLIGL